MLALGTRNPEMQQQDLVALVQGVAELVETSLSTQHRLVVDLPPEPLMAMADATELMQVVLNLCLNARDALSLEGQGEIRLSLRFLDSATNARLGGPVTVGALRNVPAALITVCDDGCGISPDIIGRIFQPFFTDKGERGSGLGLPVVASIVAGVGGALALESRPGHGTCFDVIWPLQPPQHAERLAAGLDDTVVDVLDGRAVLVVDDNPVMVETLSGLLERAGAEVGPCIHPHDALSALSDDPDAWSLLITDFDMPDMNGAELAQAVRALRPDLPILLCTALPANHRGRAGSVDLFDASITKPLSLAGLVTAAARAIANCAIRKEQGQ
jgi:CheY-like chemotaxis protein